jgi:adenylate kinase
MASMQDDEDAAPRRASSKRAGAKLESGRARPNILVTGTPGTGKTTLARLVAEQTGLKHVAVGDLVRDKALHEGKDEEFDSFVLDEDKLLDEMEDMVAPGGCVVDFHASELFPERWFDLVVVLRTDNAVLYRRLEARGYSERKIRENIEAEIMQVCLDEATEAYDAAIVRELRSETIEHMRDNAKLIAEWVRERTARSGET